MNRKYAGVVAVFALTSVGAWGPAAAQEPFQHPPHQQLFSTCEGCHEIQPGGVTKPAPTLCAACHDGQMARRVEWDGPASRPSTLDFSHSVFEAKQASLGMELSCGSCHTAAGGERMDVVRKPTSHKLTFANDHRALAASSPTQCETCHVRDECTSCHTGSEALTTPTQSVGGYHAPNFLQQHSAPAFSRDVECATCHNPEAFCRDCHAGRGLGSDGRTETGFHDRKPQWQFGHGKAARQALESCVACHAQSDCLTCHSSLTGRGVNPHGPGFDASRLASKAPATCLACHASAILNR